MFTKSSIIAAILAAASMAHAAETVNVVNNTPAAIAYALVGQGSTISQGTIPAHSTKNLPAGVGYSCKLAPQGHNPQSSSGILQFEYSNDNSKTFFNWSALNGNPDPFKQYTRTISPARPSGSDCSAITCRAGQEDTSCEYTGGRMGPVHSCPSFNGVILTATIG